MLLVSDEDRLKSQIAKDVESPGDFDGIIACIQECRRKYEEQKYQGSNKNESKFQKLKSKALGVFHKETLEEKLAKLAQGYSLTINEKGRRRIDLRAYRVINLCRECRNNRRLVRYYYFEFYNSYKDFFRGIGYIHDEVEDEE